MEIFPFLTAEAGAPAFKIENVYISRRAIGRIPRTVQGITDVKLRGRFGSTDDVRVEFKYHGRVYIVLEPYGDNSEYWICRENPGEGWHDITELSNAFLHYQPPCTARFLAIL
ncbi:hypothetical protein [Luteibacter yeojuensis]|uniref:hypothetical protein n=1 Tax=Luteibacter yeojuensis TaxID=345309 RepID=UPI0012EEAFC9|nr:hypothetical protein [Luteibacter yeojuensis]